MYVLAHCVFKELAHFFHIVKFVGIELSIIFLFYAFNVHRIYGDVFSFTSEVISAFLVSLAKDNQGY